MGDRANYGANSGGSIGRQYVELKFKLNGASLPTVLAGSSYLAKAGSVAHVGGTNVITVTMRDVWPEVIAHGPDIRDDTPNGAYATVGTFTNEGSTTGQPLTFKLNTWTAGGAVANDSTLVVSLFLAIRNSNTTYGNNP